MAFLNKTNMVTGNVIPTSDITQVIDAFTYSGSYDLLISGSVSVGTGSIQSNAKFYIKQNLKVDGGITGSMSGSFYGDGSHLTGIVSVPTFSNTSSFTI